MSKVVSILCMFLLLNVASVCTEAQAYFIETGDNWFVGKAADSSSTNMQSGMKALERGETKAAEEYFKKSASIDPANPMPYLGLAEVARMTKDTDGIKLNLDTALKLAPDSPEVHVAYARYHFMSGAYEQAEGALHRALELDPDFTPAQLELASLFATVLKQPEKAELIFQDVLAKDSRNTGALFGLGNLIGRQGKFNQAEYFMRKILTIVQHDVRPLLAIAAMYANVANYAKAVEVYTEAVTLDSNSTDALFGRAQSYLAMGSKDNALADCRVILDIQGDNPAAKFMASMILLERQDWNEAEAGFREVVRLDPGNAWALNNLAWLIGRRDATSREALEYAAKAVEIDIRNPQFLDTYAGLLRNRGAAREAASHYELATVANPGSVDLWMKLAEAREAAGQQTQALEAYQRVLDMEGINEVARRIAEEKISTLKATQ